MARDIQLRCSDACASVCPCPIQLTLSSEALCEDDTFEERQLAALVASKVYFHLGEYNESMVFALSAGKHFNIDHPGEFEDTIIGACLSFSPKQTNKTNSIQRDVSKLISPSLL